MSDNPDAPQPRDSLPDDSKLTRTKQQWARDGRFLTGRNASQAQDRLPPGQHRTLDWPVLDLGDTPSISPNRWRLDVYGAIDNPVFWDWREFMAQPQSARLTDIHCVTTWSRYDNAWDGVSTQHLLSVVKPKPDATTIVLHCYDGYDTNVSLDDFGAGDAMLVHSWAGKPLTEEHGGPMRLVVPHLYFWKSAKWIQSIEFLSADRPGFWEVRGYHNRGDPWAEQRYSGDPVE